MSDNLPAVPEPPSREVATLDTDSWVEVAKPIFALASRIYDTEFVPRGLRGSEPATAAAMLFGREIGLPPMTSLNSTHVIEGKPGISAKMMRAMVLAAGHEIEFAESTGALCTMRGRRRGQERWTEVSWTVDAARAAGLLGKSNWKNFPRRMLQARATSELCDMVFPDIVHGFRSVEELEDMTEGEGGAASGGDSASGSSKVSRRRTSKKSAARAALDSAPDNSASTAEPTGPPLPGEPGYDDSPPGPDSGVPGRGVPETAGEGADTDESPAARDADAPTGEESAPSPAPDGGPGDSPPAPGPPPTDPETPDEETSEHEHPTGPRPPSRAQMRMLWGTLGGFGLTTDEEREERLLVATTILGREVETFGTPEEPALSADEAKTLIDALAMVTPAGDRGALNRLLDEYDAAKAAQAEQDEADEAARGDES